MILDRQLELHSEADLSSVAALIGEPARAAMLTALMDGLALPAGELAELAGVSPQTASAHLTKLLEGGLLSVETHGRHRYHRLSSPQVAVALEALMTISPTPRPRSRAHKDEALGFARTCYDHLAGWLGVELARALEVNGWVMKTSLEYRVTPTGRSKLEALGLDASDLTGRACLDWTERRHHVGGALGRAVTARLLELGWVARHPSSRALRLTETGRIQLERTFHMRF
jgi:DNA-binding transcriptional ArsR family regulator/ribosomal protein S19E (S16A)